MVAHYQRSRDQERVDSRSSLEISRCSPARPLAWPGREPINLPGGLFARVRYAPIADQIPHRSELTLCARRRPEQVQQKSFIRLLRRCGRAEDLSPVEQKPPALFS